MFVKHVYFPTDSIYNLPSRACKKHGIKQTKRSYSLITPVATNAVESAATGIFMRQVQTGQLPQEVFYQYLMADLDYLRHSIALHESIQLSVRPPYQILLQIIKEATISEHAWLLHYGANLQTLTIPAHIGGAFASYKQYLDTVIDLHNEACIVAAFLACLWFYGRLGQSLKEFIDENNPYHFWLWRLQNYGNSVTLMKTMEAGSNLIQQEPPLVQQAAKNAFDRACIYDAHIFKSIEAPSALDTQQNFANPFIAN